MTDPFRHRTRRATVVTLQLPNTVFWYISPFNICLDLMCLENQGSWSPFHEEKDADGHKIEMHDFTSHALSNPSSSRIVIINCASR